jgi:hypothetical protein
MKKSLNLFKWAALGSGLIWATLTSLDSALFEVQVDHAPSAQDRLKATCDEYWNWHIDPNPKMAALCKGVN